MATETESVELVGEDVVGNVARAALFAALTGAFAYVSFPNPISPVPVSLQVFGVFLAGVFLGPLWGGISLVFYLVAGAAGAPVFAGGSAGFAPLVGYTAGYLWSYPIAASLTGAIAHGFDGLNDPETVATGRLAGGMIGGTVVIYALGTVGFSIVQDVSLVAAFTVSALAFVPFEAIKIAAAIGVVRSDAAAAA
ncbi:MAG: biotin transporter BioY [Halobellus sp.]|uniref:biotin transporter BioY n=1 Tax=Halobellus sp. TaxID=1979212 RepID=UPI0035D4D07B